MRRISGLVVAMACVATGARAAAAPVSLGRLALASAEVIVVDARGASHRAPLQLAPQAGCAEGERCLSGAATTGEIAFSVKLGGGKRALPLEVEAKPRAAMAARAIALRLVFSARGFAVLGRDYRLTRPHRAILERFDPKWIDLGDAALIVDDDLDDVTVSAGVGTVVVELELVTAPSRPFGHLPRAGRHWRDIHGRVPVPERHLAAGDVLSAHGQLLLGALPPLALLPWPAGRAAAFVVTDHADQSSAETFRALIAGTSDADLDHPALGFVGHHLPITKALFQRGALPHGGARPQLEDAGFAAEAEKARGDGFELVPHSATPVTDERSLTEATLTWFAERGAHVWIDHQPQTNREAFCQTGWHARTGIADLLEAHGYRDIWDLTEWTGSDLDERDPRHLDRHAPFLWPLGRLEAGGPGSLWMFRSTWAFVPTHKFFERYSDKALDQLERDHGVQIAHTYLETLHPTRTFLGRRNLMERGKDGVVRLDPRLETVLGSLQKRVERGSLWVTPLGSLADRLRALQGVQLRVTEAGALSVTRPPLLDDVTVVAVGVDALSGQGLLAQHRQGGELRAWLSRCVEATPCTSELSAPRLLWRDDARAPAPPAPAPAP